MIIPQKFGSIWWNSSTEDEDVKKLMTKERKIVDKQQMITKLHMLK